MKEAKIEPRSRSIIFRLMERQPLLTMKWRQLPLIDWSLEEVPLNSLKGYFGHTLGASGLVETIVGMHSLAQNQIIHLFRF